MTSEEILIRRLIANRTRVAILFASVLVIMVAAYVGSGLLPRTYEARASLAVGPAIGPGGSAPELNELLAYQRLAQTYAQLGRSRAIASTVVASSGLGVSPDDLLLRYTTTAIEDSVYIEIIARAADAEEAASLADAVAMELIAASPVADGPNAGRFLVVVDEAFPPESQAWPRPLVNTLIAGILALIGGGVALVWLESRDRPIRRDDDLALIDELSPVTSIGWSPGSSGPRAVGPFLMLEEPESPYADSVRALRGKVQIARLRGVRTILVTSAGRREGKTIVATNLAIALAQAGLSTTLVDADQRYGILSKLFGIANERGLSTHLHEEGSEIGGEIFDSQQAPLRVLPAGPSLPMTAGLIGSTRMLRLLVTLSEHAEVVVLDGPAFEDGVDARLLAAAADATILTALAERTSVHALRRMASELKESGVDVLGVVLVRPDQVAQSDAEMTYGRSAPGPTGRMA